MIKEEKVVINQTIILIEMIKNDIKKDYLKQEAERILLELKKNV